MWSIGKYCDSQQPIDYESLDEASRTLLETLNLPSVYPFCNEGPNFFVAGVPPMGNLDDRFENLSIMERLVTSFYMVAPVLWAMSELWLRLFAAVLSPIGILYLISDERRNSKNPKQGKETSGKVLITACILTLASSTVLMTDTLYVLENGETYGAALFATSVVLSTRACFRYQFTNLRIFITLIMLLAGHLLLDYETKTLSFGDKVDKVEIEGRLYHDSSNAYVTSILENWPEKFRTYDKGHGATTWMPSGDSRTGLPFLLNDVPIPQFHRLFLKTEDEEYVALDFSFPATGHNTSMPLFLVLHGLNGGSQEDYVRDLALRRADEGSTVVVMVARGLMDLPIRGWNTFHGARTSDIHIAASALRRAIAGNEQKLIGVGYSMGAIILNNYVASFGSDCALDAAISLSGGLDMRYQEDFVRAQRLWQPMLTETARNDFFLGKFGKRAKARLSESDFRKFLKAKHITELDIVAVAPYNRFDDVHHYYREMSALGDMPYGTDNVKVGGNRERKIDTLSIPLVVIHAFDDPLITWRATCANEGLMHPENLVKSGSGNLMLLMTKSGGHVGWPVGHLFYQNQWKWMSDVVGSFGNAVQLANNTL